MQIVFNFTMGMNVVSNTPFCRLIFRTEDIDGTLKPIGDFGFGVEGIDALIRQLEVTKANIALFIAQQRGNNPLAGFALNAAAGPSTPLPSPAKEIQENPALGGPTENWIDGYRGSFGGATNPHAQGSPAAIEWQDGYEYGLEMRGGTPPQANEANGQGQGNGSVRPPRDTA